MHTSLPIVVEETDVGLFYALMAAYHKDKAAFRIEAHNLGIRLEGRGGPSKDSSKEKSQEVVEGNDGETQSLYAHVTENCTCGTCYGKLAKPDRVPWRSSGDGKFVNAKHGSVRVVNCRVGDFNGLGYIYVNPSQYELDAKMKTREIQLKKSQEDAQHDKDMKQEQRKQAKVKTEIEKIQVEQVKQKVLTAKRPHDNKIAAQRAELQELMTQNNQDYAAYEDKVNSIFQGVRVKGGIPKAFYSDHLKENFTGIWEVIVDGKRRNLAKWIKEDPKAIRQLIIERVLGPYKFSKSVELQTLRNILRNSK